MPEYTHPTNGPLTGYDFYDYSPAVDDQHCGWDVGGTAIRNVRAGSVTHAGFEASMGNYAYVQSGNVVIRYLHMKYTPVVHIGQAVAQGEQLGVVGATGWATGEHLHFDVSCLTTPEALAEVRRYGGAEANTYWRAKTGRTYLDPALLIGKDIQEENDMRVFHTIDSKAYHVVDGLGARQLNTMLEVAMCLRASGQATTGPEDCYQEEIDAFPNAGKLVALMNYLFTPIKDWMGRTVTRAELWHAQLTALDSGGMGTLYDLLRAIQTKAGTATLTLTGPQIIELAATTAKATADLEAARMKE